MQINQTTRNGNIILSYTPGEPPVDGTPVTFTLAVIRHAGGIVLIHNTNRQQWEVPGGGIEPGETLEQCVIREVYEEATQTISNPILKGTFKFQFEPDHRLEYGVLFEAHLDELAPFAINNEANALMILKSGDPFPSAHSTLSRVAVEILFA